MRVVRGKEVARLGETEVAELLDGYERVVVDVGTGDGRFAYAYARQHPDAFVIGLDATAENLRETSRRAVRKPARGGLSNVAYVWAAAEHPPPELAGRAGEIYVILPWGRLLDGLALAEADTLEGLATLAAPGATLRVTVNCEVWTEDTPVTVRHLPELSPEYARETLATRYAAHGIVLTDARMLTRAETRRISSPWAKRIRASRDWPRFLYLEAAIPEARRADGP